MSKRTFTRLSVAVAILSGLIPAFFLVSSSGRSFGVVRASAGSSPSIPSEPFSVVFSEPMPEDAPYIRPILSPDIPFRTEWNTDRKRLLIIPEGRWETGGSYRLTVGGTRIGIMKTLEAASFSFEIPEYPEIVSVTPSDGSTDVLLDIEDPIIVRFDRSVRDFYVDFRLSPEMGVAYESDGLRSEFRILPKEASLPGTRYGLSVFVKWRGEPDEAYRETGRVSFTTLAKEPDEWSSDLAERVVQAKRFARPAVLTGKYIDVNRSNQIMTLFEDGRPVDAYPVSSGKPGMETPAGRYEIRNKADRPWSSAYGLYMPNWMALVSDGKFGIHELPEWPGGYKEGADHLGIPVSHGCVRLGVGPAKRVFDWAEIGTPVIVR